MPIPPPPPGFRPVSDVPPPPPGFHPVGDGDIDMSHVAGAGPGGPPQLPAHEPVSMTAPPAIGTVSDSISNFGKHAAGAVTGLLHAATDAPSDPGEAAASLLGAGPLTAYRTLVKPSISAVEEAAKLHAAGGPRSGLLAGSTYDENGQYVPTAGSKLIDAIPMYGPWARGAENELHTQGILPSAAGVAGDLVGAELPGMVGRGMRAMAPPLAEAAMKTQPMDRTFGRTAPGRTPGEALLRETTGSDPGDVARQAHERVDALNRENELAAENTPTLLDAQPVRASTEGFHQSALTRGHPGTAGRTKALLDQLSYPLDTEPSSGGKFKFNYDEPLPAMLAPRYMMDVKRGVNNLGTAWKAEGPSDLSDAAVGNAYHLLDEQLDNAVPGHKERNERMASLLPVAKRMGAADLNAGVLQKSANRMATPTGAMAPAGVGAYFGGLPGAIAGTILPDALTSPKTILRGARLLDNAPVIPKRALLPMAAGRRDE